MKYKNFFALLCCVVLLATGCKKDNDKDANTPVLRLTPDNITAKSGRVVEATLYITAPGGVKSLTMYKTINLQRDNDFGGSGTMTAMPVNTSGDNYEYRFTYQMEGEEVDKLVGINFRLEDNEGRAAEKDLTLNTITSGQQTIYSRKWKLVSRMWTSITPPAEDKKPCEDDNVFSWNADSTYNVSFGTSACDFDGFNVFDRWILSEDEKTFTQVYHSVFDPSNITTETYTVKTLTRDRLVLVQLIDLTIFGLTDKEVFESTYEPAP
ncbi:MAG: hypothetical protein EOO09_13860 [Chitinophagaceae bacterium]|nr:MAG: hypothetical protein EOO09_13860 [Chitinophagaceae bacterium]